MWEQASARNSSSVHPLLGVVNLNTPGGKPTPSLFPLGSAFLLNKSGQFLTNAHVVSENGAPRKDLQIVLHLPGSADFRAATVEVLDPSRDLAIVRVADSGAATPVAFASAGILPMGAAVASLGYPIPAVNQMAAGQVEIDITRRLATGFVSGFEAQYRFTPGAGKEFVYEFNMLSYPGNSGSPAFTLDGRIVGINHATVIHGGGVAAFALATRNAELLPWLQGRKIEYSDA